MSENNVSQYKQPICDEMSSDRHFSLLQMVQDEAFTAFVREDAASIRDRETTDTIPIIDDIRYHISSFMQTFSDMYEANEKLTLIDNFLEELCLDA